MCTPYFSYSISYFRFFVKGFFEILLIFFLAPLGFNFAPFVLSLKYILIIPYPIPKVKHYLKILFRQIAQIPGELGRKVCAICRLTKLLGCGIMVNSVRAAPARTARNNEKRADFSALLLAIYHYNRFVALFHLLTHSVKQIGNFARTMPTIFKPYKSTKWNIISIKVNIIIRSSALFSFSPIL